MVTAKSATATKKGLADGTVDIVIGTHAVLSKSIEFMRLGLLIIDEEQHFGVKHKERLKQLKAEVHVLTMSATPIPRTLQLAQIGRASCRERVCQYAYLSVVAVSLKNKTNYLTTRRLYKYTKRTKQKK